MSPKPQCIPPVPEDTASVARAAFPKGNAVLRLRDQLGTIYHDELFAALYPEQGQPAAAPWRLAPACCTDAQDCHRGNPAKTMR
jgi:transposase